MTTIGQKQMDRLWLITAVPEQQRPARFGHLPSLSRFPPLSDNVRNTLGMEISDEAR